MSGRETWLRAIARRACLPVAVVERVLKAAIGVGLDPAIPTRDFEGALRQAIEAHRRHEAEQLQQLVAAAERARANGACAGLVVINGGRG